MHWIDLNIIKHHANCYFNCLITFADSSNKSMQTENHLLKKRVNLFDGISIVAGAMIGSGIFIVSADIARTVGSPGWLMVVWLITGIITVIGAISYGELASMMPHVGGQYVYLKEAYHPLIGFLFGWTTFLVIQCGSIAAVAVAFAKFSGVLFPWISDTNNLVQYRAIKDHKYHDSCNCNDIFLTWLNTRGIVTGKTVVEYLFIHKNSGPVRIYSDRFFRDKRNKLIRDQ